MKILHTSDWHLGQIFYGYDRSEDDEEMLRHIKEFAVLEGPDALLVSGDVYNIAAPSSAAQRLFTEGIVAIRKACPGMAIVITAGNHDSASRLEATKELWREIGVSVVGSVARDSEGHPDFSPHIIEIEQDGRTIGFVGAVPYCYVHNFPTVGEAQGNERQGAWFRALLDEIGKRNTAGLPVVLMAHLAVSGSDLTGHSFGPTNREIEFADLSDFGQGFDYLALGHIHCPQTLANSGGKARYCGAPKAVSFDEEYHHGVTIAEVKHGQAPEIREVWRDSSRPVVTWPKDPAPFEEALAQLDAYETKAKRGAYLRLNVLMDAPLPMGAQEQVVQAAEERGFFFCDIKRTMPELPNEAKEAPRELSVSQLREMRPEQVAESYLRQKGRDMTDDYRAKLSECITSIEEEERK